MKEYESVYKLLSIESPLLDIINNKIKLPFPNTQQQPASLLFGFPPALIPIFSDTSMHYIAYWKHWFNNRIPTIIRLFAGSKYAVEIARNPIQLFYNLIIDCIGIDDEVSDNCLSFASNLGIPKETINKIDEYTLEKGAFLSALLEMDELKDNEPLSCFEDNELKNYKLDFPHKAIVLDENILKNICGYECDEKLIARIKQFDNPPLWFISNKQYDNFKSFMNQEDFNGAWMCLNSSGWLFEDMKTALETLAQKANNRDFEALAQAWLSLNFYDRDGI